LLRTERLDLIPCSVDTVRASIDDPALLGRLMGADVPESWPPELLDRDALEWTLNWLQTPGNDPRWSMHWIVLRVPRTLVGVVGYKGGPKDGTVEVGYGVVHEFQRRGIAPEATQALVQQAFTSPGVDRVIAETLPSLEPSIRVLDRCGFRFIGEGSEPGVIRYEKVRR
jgi:ribosomal-protein-alanine N-acetyltransferase